MTKVEIVSRTEGVGIYEGLPSGEIVEAVARHGAKKDYGRLIRYLIRNKHWSPLEHVHYSFRIETARDISAQMIRHRSFHWQELSQRYDLIQEFMPIDVRLQGKTNRQVGDQSIASIVQQDYGVMIFPNIVMDEETDRFKALYNEEQLEAIQTMRDSLMMSMLAYQKATKAGIARECARRILPMCSKTVVHMTGNLRDFLGYLNVRCEEGTQKEHREIADAIGEALELEFPELKELGWRGGGFM
jgi:thymidylate synthase (FAD)